MALLLSLETSTDVCSVAIHDENKLVKDLIIDQPQAHAARLAPMIRDVLEQASIKFEDLSAVCVSAGPGSYTGLRIGASTAKGICFADDIPLIAVPTLELLAFQVIQQQSRKDTLLCPMIDARRMEVYCQVFDHRMQTVQPIDARIIEESSFDELLRAHKMLFFGNGAEKCRSVIRHANAEFLEKIFPSASFLGLAGYQRFLKNDFQDLVNFKPLYLKDFIAKKAHPLLG